MILFSPGKSTRVWFVWILMVLAWSWSPVLTKFTHFSTSGTIFSRASVGLISIALAALVFLRERPRLNRNAVVAGLLIAVASSAYLIAMTYGAASTGIVLVYTSPFWAIGADHLLERRKLSPRFVVAALAVLIGIYLLVYEKRTPITLLAAFYALLCGAAFGIRSVVLGKERTADGNIGPTVWGAMLLGYGIGSVVSLAFAPNVVMSELMNASARDLGYSAANGVLLALPGILHSRLSTEESGTFATLVGAAQIPVSVLWAFLSLGERLDPHAFVGAILVFSASLYVMLVTTISD